MLLFSCPGCETKLRAAEEQSGQKVRCPKCGRAVRVPESESPDEEPTPSTQEEPEEPTPKPRRRRKKRRPAAEGNSGFWGWALAGVGRWVLGVIVTLVVNLVLCCGVLTYWHVRARVDPDFAADVAEEPEAIKLTAAQLTQELQANPDVAEERFVDEFLEVSGKVQRTGRTPQKGAYVVLEGGPPGTTVQCLLELTDEDEEGRFQRLTAGQSVTVRGWYSQRRGGTVILEECELVP